MLEIQPREVKRLLDEQGGEWVLLDCREPVEVQIARIDGCLHIPMGEIPSRLPSLDPDKPTIVYCHHGVRSLHVAEFLRRQDFAEVRSMAGGIDAWSRQIDPQVPTY